MVVGQEPGIGTGLRTAVLISGSGTNLQAIIDAVLHDGLGIHLCAVLSDRPEATGLTRARTASIATRTIDYTTFDKRATAERRLASELAEFDPQLVILAGFMRIIPADLVEAFHGRMLNIHPSLLPKYRGLNTYHRAIEAGEAWHGSTVHYVIPELDSGPSIIQYRVPIHAGETETSLSDRVRHGEYIIYPRAIGWIADARLKLAEAGVELDGKILESPVVVEETA
jgi:phosphoribosylglycinamide formyltransferase-1